MVFAAEAALLTNGFTFQSHRSVLSVFGQQLVKTGELPAELHQWLLDAFDKRQLGDYVPVSQLEEQDIRELQVKATAFGDAIERWLHERGDL